MIRHAVQVVKTTTVTYVIETPDEARTRETDLRAMAELVERVELAEAMGTHWPEGCVQRVMVKQPDRVEYLLGHPELRFELTRGDEKGR